MADSTATQGWGAQGTFTITLASLANGSARQSASLDLTAIANVEDLLIWVTSKAASATGYLRVYCAGSPDNTIWSDNFTGADAAITIDNPPNVGQAPDVNMADSNATTGAAFSLKRALGVDDLPKRVAIAILNATGQTLSATGGDHAITYQVVFKSVGP